MNSDIQYLLSLQAVRDRANKVFDIAKRGALNHFEFHPEKLPTATDYIVNVISRDFGPDRFHEIPPHGRWQHFNVGGVDRIAELLASIKDTADLTEQTRVLTDLFFVSVLLDAGAGDKWRYKEPGSGATYERSEGIAVASLHMFKAGLYSSNSGEKLIVDAQGLESIDEEQMSQAFQISTTNPMVGIGARVELLRSVGRSLKSLPDIFGQSGRPGNLVDHILRSSKSKSLEYSELWNSLQRVLIPSWPKSRTHIDGQPIGDAWPLKVLEQDAQEHGDKSIISTIQPFHKLTQWLAYSLSVPFTRLLDMEWANINLGTGLPEYRNGGFLVDIGVLSLKPNALAEGQSASKQALPMFKDTSDVIVEWRALTVALLDELHGLVAKSFASKGVQLSMAQMLEAGSWKSGREIAAHYRPETKSSPILIDGDGTLF